MNGDKGRGLIGWDLNEGRPGAEAVRADRTCLRCFPPPIGTVARMRFCGGLPLLHFDVADGFFKQPRFAIMSKERTAGVELSRASVRRIDLAHNPSASDSDLTGHTISTYATQEVVDPRIGSSSFVPRQGNPQIVI